MGRDLAIRKDLPYAERPGCTLDLIRPADASGERLPVVVHLHGGAFRVFSKETHAHAAARYARAGFAVVNVDYRLAPTHRFPAAVRDVHDALRYASAQADTFGLDLDRTILAGESAGANLALGLALSCVTDRPEPWARAVYALGIRPRSAQLAYGLLQVSDPERYGRDVPAPAVLRWRLPQITRDYLGDATESTAYADPLCAIEQGDDRAEGWPTIFALCGTLDPIADDTRRLTRACRRRRLPVEETWIEGAGHGFHLLPGPPAQRAWEALIAQALASVDARSPRRSTRRA